MRTERSVILRRIAELIEFEKAGDRYDSVITLMQVRDWLAARLVDDGLADYTVQAAELVEAWEAGGKGYLDLEERIAAALAKAAS